MAARCSACRAEAGAGQLLSCATTMQLGRKSLRERITLIAKKPKMAAYTLVFVLVLSLVPDGLHVYRRARAAGAGTCTEPVQTEPEPIQPEEPPADTEAPQPVEDDPEAGFQMAFPMLNYASFQRYLDEHAGDAGQRLGAYPHQRSGL
ncbi:MAG: hypothetical protein ACLU3I_21930 [Acutalibacteraceae bacterium]